LQLLAQSAIVKDVTAHAKKVRHVSSGRHRVESSIT
jgi:hypothetical protein